MIAQFYNKFDELHEASLAATLSKNPNKKSIKNEVKYRIPERWTKKFHKQDIISNDILQQSGIAQERGKVNVAAVLAQREQADFKREQSISDQISGAAQIANPILHHSLSSRSPDSKSQLSHGLSGPASPARNDPNLQFGYAQKQSNAAQLGGDGKTGGSPGVGGGESTDAQSRLAEDEDAASSSKVSNAFGAAHLYDWSEVAYLFESGEIPEELAAITDPIEYNYLLVRLRKEFNEKHKSNYLKYMNLKLPYHSRRDEVGGAITDQDWSNFVHRLEGIIAKVKSKRRRIIRRRKKRGKKLMPRATLFKPTKKINLRKDPLWNEIFVDASNPAEESSEEEDRDLAKMYRDACKKAGVAVPNENFLRKAKRRTDAKVELANL